MTTDVGLFEHFRLLFTLRGKENRGSFWPYAALVLGILMACNVLLMIPMMIALVVLLSMPGAPARAMGRNKPLAM